MSRYAAHTAVPVDRSRAEAEKTLMRYGAHGFLYARDRRIEPCPRLAGDCAFCGSTGRIVLREKYGPSAREGTGRCPRCTPSNAPEKIDREFIVLGFKIRLDGREREVRLEVPMPHEVEVGTRAKVEAATRQRWRALNLVLKAKLEAVHSGISTLESEFMAGIVLPNGMTLGQAVLPRLTEVVETGRLLPAKGDTSVG